MQLGMIGLGRMGANMVRLECRCLGGTAEEPDAGGGSGRSEE
jgi:hypothetical protein